MADNKWTSEQLKAIETRDRRLLVSAAAGSGKTAVLVERIIRRILDPADPVDADRLLVITFTRAAAAEMKDRIRRRLEAALHEKGIIQETAGRIRSQIAILDSANIQTIDSFCMNVVKDHTDELNIDPNFRIAEQTELTLMQADIMEELLEECYEKAEDDFISFTDAFGEGNAGGGIEDRILKVFGFAQVTPDPEAWYSRQLDANDITAVTDYVYREIRQLAASLIPALEKSIAVCSSTGGPAEYEPMIRSDLDQIEALAGSADFTELNNVLRAFDFRRLSTKKSLGGDDRDGNKRDAVKAAREEIKKTVRGWQTDYTREDAEEIVHECELTAPYIRVLVSLAREFDRRYSQKKREKNVADFSDVEHMAYEALKYTDEYKKKFSEICVDEYQDTNLLQEEIIASIDDGNVFMVGDVKQSVYRFRQARPDIFMHKYETFRPVESSEDADAPDDTLISLSRNFRSRAEVLDSVNRLFRILMRKEVGGVSYTPDAELNPGAVFGNADGSGAAGDNGSADGSAAGSPAMDPQTELLLVNTAGLSADDTAQAAQARMIASKIRELTDPETGVNVWDGGEYRRARCSDIVILLRSSNVDGEVYLNELLNAGIRAHCDTNKGYFNSLEVRTMTAILCAIDNPRKDIEYTAFLHSPIIGMTDDELTVLRKKPEKLGDLGRYKYDRAGQMLARYREMSRYMCIEDLITKIYDETGYYEYAMSLPAGKVRKANLDKLRQMAAEYAQTGYRGLFNFIRYIDNLKTYDTDFGEASVAGGSDDAVNIMSIHKSKGLEFPIVFIAECNKRFNIMDSNQAVLIDDELGVACRYVNLEERYRQNTFSQMALRLKLRNDTIGEELRILYVAMTRAKEKLYLTATIDDGDAFISEYEERAEITRMAAGSGSTAMPLADINSSSGYLYWIIRSGVGYKYTIADAGEAVAGSGEEKPEKIRKYLDGLTVDTYTRDRYAGIFDFVYEHQADVNLRNKISISELKKQWMIDKLGEDLITGESEIEEKDFSAGTSITGAERGTLYHSVMEKLDYTRPEETLAHLPEVVREKDIRAFIGSEIGNIFLKAQKEGRLFRERQFIMGLPAREIGAADSDEPVLVQGIIDAFVMSEDGSECILVDYKTDRVADGQELIDRYEGQMHYYARALGMMRDCKVTEKIIWSFALGRAVKL